MSDSPLKKYGEFASRNPEIVVGTAVVLTILLAFSALSIRLETDFSKSLPQDLEVVKNQNLLEDVFSESSNIFVLAKLNTKSSSGREIKDIRDPEFIEKLYELEEILRDSPDVNTVFGAPDIVFQIFGSIPNDEEALKQVLSGSEIVSRDHSLTMLVVRLNGGAEQERVARISRIIEDDIESVGFPGSVELTITGAPLVGKVIFDLLFQDLFNTIIMAGILILIVLVVAYRSPIRGAFSISVLLFAVVWTGGTMSLINVPLTIVTVTVGALVIGIGIDYSIHIINRYAEEVKKRLDEQRKICREGMDYQSCMRTCFICYGISVDRVGRAIIGTAATTIASFAALAASGVPFLSQMAISLSLGIFYSMVVSLFVLPALLSIGERIRFLEIKMR